jgi:hypothetical protein
LLTLDTAPATKVFDKVKSILAQVLGVTGVPLVYVIRVVLIPEDKNEDFPFGEEEIKYTSVDMEKTACAPILSNKADIYNKDPENLEAYGLFVPTFLTDTKKVWSIFLACFGLSSAWQHVKKFASQQNGRQAWCTLHNHFFGGNKVNTMVSDILLTLRVCTTVVTEGILHLTSTALLMWISTIAMPLWPGGDPLLRGRDH